MEDKTLIPLGSIVKLRGNAKKAMIVARAVGIKQGDGMVYFEYAACGYPEGVISDQLMFFDTKEIAEVVWKGYADEDNDIVMKDVELWRKEKKKI